MNIEIEMEITLELKKRGVLKKVGGKEEEWLQNEKSREN